MPDRFPTHPTIGPRRLSPTDVSQFVRLEQCERYLRFRLHERAHGSGLFKAADAAPQSIPPLLTRSGRQFEERIEATIATHHPARSLADHPDDANALVVAETQALAAGQVQVLFQPRLRVELDGWLFTGDVDLLRLAREADGTLDVLVVDMKGSTAARVEHRLQVAFYHAMLARLFGDASTPVAIRTAILYEGPGDGAPTTDPEHAEAARALLGVDDAYLELVADPEGYLEAVEDLVTGPQARARRIADAPFEDVPYHLALKCDGCLYNELCMRMSAEDDDLSLLPHLTMPEKQALQRAGVRDVRTLASLKDLHAEGQPTLVPAPGAEALCRTVATTWPVGPRLDELVLRARRYRRFKGDDLASLSYIPSKGHGSLPHVAPDHHSNLVAVYLDAQHDYLENRLYLLGGLVVAHEAGEVRRERRIVRLTEGPPRDAEAEGALLADWIRALLEAVVTLAAPDADGQPRAPVHLVFYNRYAMRVLLDALARHFQRIVGAAPALYDFITQLASYDSPIASFLEEEIRERKNYPMVCQSLQSVARFLGFDWNADEPFTEHFRERLFDYVGRREGADGAPEWYTRRSRFNSQIPLEYAYQAWDELDQPPAGGRDDYAPYRAATRELLVRFHARRLDALAWIARDFTGNPLTTKSSFVLPALAGFSDVARTLAQALDEFVAIERHVSLADWQDVRHLPPERRVLLGETLIGRFAEGDQAPEVVAANRENTRRYALRAAYEAQGQPLSKAQKDETKWSQDGLVVRLRLDCQGVDCALEDALALSTFQPGAQVVLMPRWSVDERLPPAERRPFQPTPKQLLYAPRAVLEQVIVERDAEDRPVAAFAELRLINTFGGAWSRGFVFSAFDKPLVDGELYTIDPCPNDWYGYFCMKIVSGLRAIEEGTGAGRNALYERIAHPETATCTWPAAAAAGQARFLAGLDALHAAGAFHDLEPSKRAYIGDHGGDPILLVQGPPGTGKSYSTAFAILARMQGAMAAGRDFRAFVGCKTHAATDVLLGDVREAQRKLAELRDAQPAIFAAHFDARLLEAPVMRVHPREGVPDGVVVLAKDASGVEKMQTFMAAPWCVVATTPGGVYRLVKDRWPNALFSHAACDCLVLDEASQMNLPEAMMAALLLKPDGQFIVVGDPRQMPPIVQHDWDGERRRTFQEYRAYESLFATLLPLAPPMIKFEESFRLHAAMATFLREEIYQHDGIAYFSRRHDLLPAVTTGDPFVNAVLDPAHPLVVVVHDEAASQTRNAFEQALIGPVLAALASAEGLGLDADHGLGVVVPHRAQRAALQLAFPFLGVVDDTTGEVQRWAVDTVERFQGGERTAIVISATESEPAYLLVSGKFLLDPRRLTVALSRAKRKLVLVAARSVFQVFSPDEQTFEDARLWKRLWRRTCTEPLWAGEREGQRVEVWGGAG